MLARVESLDSMLKRVNEEFQRRFNYPPDIVSCAPGRVNLIGEHIDYNDGFVLPMALPMVTLFAGRPNGKNCVNLVTLTDGIGDGQQNTVSFDLDKIKPASEPKWVNYVIGVIHLFPEKVPGFDAVISTNVPIGGGLSSSAALEVSTITFLEALTKTSIATQKDKALICQQAEHKFAGMPCGVMDQMISVMGERGSVLLLDCQSCIATSIPFKSEKLAILICNSNVKHELSNSEYPVRKSQCEEVLRHLKMSSFRDGDPKNLDSYLTQLSDPILKQRARHVFTEIHRTIEAADALNTSDFRKMGKLMTESHKSLDEDYEVSCREINVLVEAALKCEGVYGSRITGGGFGGCTVTLIEKEFITKAIEKITEEYSKITGGKATFYLAVPSDGARLLEMNI